VDSVVGCAQRARRDRKERSLGLLSCVTFVRGFSMAATLKIFVLVDTHDKLPANLEALAAGADEIWHLGDVCAPAILETIKAFGPPVAVVRGNCDSNFDWPLMVDLKRNGIRFRLVHIPPDH